MKCLSLWQPWASLLVHGRKRIETRSWNLSHRGPLLIHAAREWNREQRRLSALPEFATAITAMYPGGTGYLPVGAVIGMVEVVDCVPVEQIHFAAAGASVSRVPWEKGHWQVPEDDRPFGNFAPGRFGIVCENPVVFAKPIPVRDSQRVFEVSDTLITGAA